MFHVKHDFEGYDSADFFCETLSVIASDQVKKDYRRLREIRYQHNLFIKFHGKYVSCEP